MTTWLGISLRPGVPLSVNEAEERQYPKSSGERTAEGSATRSVRILGETLEAIITGRLMERPMVRFWLTCFGCFLVVVAGLLWTLRRSAPVDVESIPTVSLGAQKSEAETTTVPTGILVHVAGEVVRPGLFTLAPGDRVARAVEKAGGPTDGADLHRLNLALVVDDGMSIIVPSVGESGVFVRGAEGAGEGPTNINSADSQALQRLSGVGPSTGDAIITWRDENGPFESVDDLLSVPGIGPAKLEALRDHIEV